MARRVGTETRWERFWVGFLGSLLLMAIGMAVVVGFTALLWRFGPFIAFPALGLALAAFAGFAHATGDNSPAPVTQKDKAE